MGQEVRYRVRGGRPLSGTAFIQGAKNAVLPMIGAALLAAKGRTVLRNVPVIEDVYRALELAEHVGAKVAFHESERTVVIDASGLNDPERAVLPADIAARFRGSVLFVPALMHRTGRARIEGVGGCNLGSRNLDFHYRGFARLGAEVTEDLELNHINVEASKLRGGHLYLDTPSHTGTENLLMAAVLAPGTTVIEHAALEPEVIDVINFLSAMGAKISGGGTGLITVEGVEELTAVEHTIMSDRIDAGVFAMTVAATGGEVSLVGANLDHLGVARWKLEQMGVGFSQEGAVLHVQRDPSVPLRPINAVTSPFPGFATDLQSPLMALATLAEDGSARYDFRMDDAADWRWRPGELPESLGPGVEAVHAASIALFREPGASRIGALLRREHGRGRVTVTLDPNIRPDVIGDPAAARALALRHAAQAHVVMIEMGLADLALGPLGGADCDLEGAAIGVQAHQVALPESRQGAAVHRLRGHVDGRRHLAGGAGHAPVGDQRHLEAAILQHAQVGGELVQLRHAVGLGALEAHHHHHVTVQFAGLAGEERADKRKARYQDRATKHPGAPNNKSSNPAAEERRAVAVYLVIDLRVPDIGLRHPPPLPRKPAQAITSPWCRSSPCCVRSPPHPWAARTAPAPAPIPITVAAPPAPGIHLCLCS